MRVIIHTVGTSIKIEKLTTIPFPPPASRCLRFTTPRVVVGLFADDRGSSETRVLSGVRPGRNHFGFPERILIKSHETLLKRTPTSEHARISLIDDYKKNASLYDRLCLFDTYGRAVISKFTSWLNVTVSNWNDDGSKKNTRSLRIATEIIHKRQITRI